MVSYVSQLNSDAEVAIRVLIDVDKEGKLLTSCEKYTAAEVAADALGEGWEGHVVQFSGGKDRQGFPMSKVPGSMQRALVVEAGASFFFFSSKCSLTVLELALETRLALNLDSSAAASLGLG